MLVTKYQYVQTSGNIYNLLALLHKGGHAKNQLGIDLRLHYEN